MEFTGELDPTAVDHLKPGLMIEASLHAKGLAVLDETYMWNTAKDLRDLAHLGMIQTF